MTTEQFIEKAREIHGNIYDYSKTIYVNNYTKVCIICPKHGEFWQKPQSHLNGCKCSKCKGNKRLTTEEFIAECKKVHGNKYIYDKTEYVNKRSKVIITCPIHGDFEQNANNHKRGQGCPLCSSEYTKEKGKYNYSHFIEESNNRFNDEYTFPYIKDEYENSHSKITIIHNKCGMSFKKIACDHLTSPLGGCRYCYTYKTKPEMDIIGFIKQIIEEDENIVNNDRNTLNENNEIDIFLPNHKLGIEYDGLYWHSENFKGDNYHLNKTIECESQGIRLIHIFEDEWLFKGDIVRSRLRNILGLTPRRIFARKCTLKEVSYKESKAFLDENHIQGNCMSRYRYGLYYKNELVSLMTFGKLRKNLNGKTDDNGSYELLRFCNKIDTTVVGGASRLIKRFIQEVKPLEITSYADRRWSDGKLYEKLGFKLDHTSKPNYFYVIGNKRENRFNYRKDVLIKKYGCPKEMSEHDFCLSQKWYRIYDCGCLCYKKTFI